MTLFYNKYISSHKTVGTHSAINFSSLFLKRFQQTCHLQEGLKIYNRKKNKVHIKIIAHNSVQ